MDFFGIGNAIKGMVGYHIVHARQTGKTTQMIKHLQDGDRVICSNYKEAERLNRLFKDAGKKVECIAVDPKDTHRLVERGVSSGQTIFDHQWVEKFYQIIIDQASNEIGFFQKRLSGSGISYEELTTPFKTANNFVVEDE